MVVVFEKEGVSVVVDLLLPTGLFNVEVEVVTVVDVAILDATLLNSVAAEVVNVLL